MHVTIYSTSTCTYCGALRAWLDGRNIPYDYKLIDANPDIMKEYVRVSEGVVGVPFTVIEDESSKISKILGFDKRKLQAALAL
jgi:glutaredoxin 3